MKALVVQEGKKVAVEEKPIPSVAADEVLVKVVAVALNPTDWKHVEYLAVPGVIVGCDFSGVVEKVGENVKHVKVGDKVGALTHGSKFETFGAFAEYTTTVGDVVWKKPEHLTHEENATFGVGGLTAVATLFQKLGLPTPLKPAAKSFPILIWAGSSSVGQFAVQLAKLAGLEVVATCSPRNFDLVKSLGASHVFDYRDADVVKKIKEVTNNQLAYAFDCVSENETQTKSAESMGEKGGKIGVILGAIENKPREDVQFVNELLYTAFGKAFTYRGKETPAQPQDRAFIRDYIRDEYNQLLQDKKLKPNVLKQMSGGVAGIPEGLEYLKSGKVSAEKLVYHIQDE